MTQADDDWDEAVIDEWKSEFESMTLAELIAWPDEPDAELVAFYADVTDARQHPSPRRPAGDTHQEGTQR